MKKIKTKKNRIPMFWNHFCRSSLGSDIIIKEFGLHMPPPGHVFSESRNDYLLQFFIDGVCRLEVADKTYTLKKGTAFLIPPKTFHLYADDTKKPSTRICLSFSGANAVKIAALIQNNTSEYVFSYSNDEKVIKYIDELFYCRDESPRSLLNIYSCFYKMLSLLTDKKPQDSLGDGDSLLINDIIQYILLNLKDGVSMEKLCRVFGYGRTALYQKFKLKTGVSPQEFIIERRLSMAKNLLANTEQDLEKIAEACGYSNVESLNKLFLRHQKETLTQYRKSKEQ